MVDKTRIVLDGVDPFQVVEPVFECVRVTLSCLGETFSPAYIQGISGAAFRIAGICPCAPTCSTAMWTDQLVALLGFEMRHLKLTDLMPDYNWDHLQPLAQRYEANGNVLPDAEMLGEANQRRMCEQIGAIIEAVKAEIRAGRPAIVWHAFTNAEFDVVAGFDEQTGVFYGRGSYAGTGDAYAKAPWGRMVTAAHIGGQPSAITLGERVRPFDARSAEIGALQEAVSHARSQANAEAIGGEEWAMLDGLLCYDRWIGDWRNPTRTRTPGDSYCLGVYRSTRRAAAAFLREIAPRYPEVRTQLNRAARGFEVEADALDAAVPLLWWEAPVGPDPGRNAQLVPLLQQARDGYARAMDQIETALDSGKL